MLMETRTPLKKEESIGEAETVMKSNVVDWQYLTPGEKHAQKRREAERAVHFMADSCASPSRMMTPRMTLTLMMDLKIRRRKICLVRRTTTSISYVK